MWFYVIVLIATFLFSRLFLWVIQKISGKQMYAVSHVLSLVLSAITFSIVTSSFTVTMVSGFLQGIMICSFPQFLWLALDFAKFEKNK